MFINLWWKNENEYRKDIHSHWKMKSKEKSNSQFMKKIKCSSIYVRKTKINIQKNHVLNWKWNQRSSQIHNLWKRSNVYQFLFMNLCSNKWYQYSEILRAHCKIKFKTNSVSPSMKKIKCLSICVRKMKSIFKKLTTSLENKILWKNRFWIHEKDKMVINLWLKNDNK